MSENVTPLPANSRINFATDKFLPTIIEGWARYLETDRPVTLELLVNGITAGSFRADIYRADLEKMRPDGCFAFHLTPFDQYDWQDKVPQDAFMQLKVKDDDVIVGEAVWNGLGPVGQNNIADPNGCKLQLNKGRFVIPLSARPAEWKTELISSASKIASEANASGFKVCASYGTLLGAVREGALIEHDDDVDLMFISNETTILKAVDDFHRFQSFLINKNYEIKELSNGQIHARHDGGFSVDIFLAWFEHNRLSLTFSVRCGVAEDEVLPFGSIELLNQKLPIPNKPESLLEAIYGPNWKSPDPAFVWSHSQAITDYFAPLHNYQRGANSKYWDEYYSKRDDISPPQLPTQCALFALSVRTIPNQIIDLGCGNGRDTLFFASQGIKTVGLDYAQTAIDSNKAAARLRGLEDHVSFRQVDVSNLGQVKDTIEFVNRYRTSSPLCVYSRFFFHALDENAEGAALLLISHVLQRPADFAVIEFRTARDAERAKVTAEHYRRYIEPKTFTSKARNIYGLTCTYQVEGTGYAVFKDDDAHVVRMILEKSQG